MREHKRRIDSLASQAYGSGRLTMNAVGEWFWLRDQGGRVYLGWSLDGAEHRLKTVVSGDRGRSISQQI